jgi:NTP pyrophosphatase (non-canonical NTP hydrolase)
VDLDQYQTQLRSLNQSIQVEGNYFEFNCIGLAEEAGEVMGKLKRALRGEGFDRQGYLLELGDVLAYLALAAGAKEIKMSEIEDLVVPMAAICENYDFQIKSASKNLYDSVNNLLNDIWLSDKERLRWRLCLVLQNIDWSANAAESGLTELMSLNLEKLNDRLKRNGTLLGIGDNR